MLSHAFVNFILAVPQRSGRSAFTPANPRVQFPASSGRLCPARRRTSHGVNAYAPPTDPETVASRRDMSSQDLSVSGALTGDQINFGPRLSCYG